MHITNKPLTHNIYEQKYKKYKHKYINIKNNEKPQCKQINFSNKNTNKSLEQLINFFEGWENDDYAGIFDINIKPRSDYSNLIEYKTLVDIAQCPTLNKLKNLELSKYSSNAEGITKFLNDFNFIESKKFNIINPSFYRIEGSSNEHLIIHNKILKKFKEEPKYIMEIGFNSGISAINFLNNTKHTIVVSFDIMLHNYCWYSKMFIDNKYPDRHILIAGDSSIQVKTIGPLLNFKFDLIFIDGDHNYYSAYNDIVNSKLVAHKDTVVILDNVAPHAGCGIGPYLAMNQAIKDNIIIFKKHYETENYFDGFAILQYKFDDIKSNKINYIKIERLIPIYRLTDILKTPSNIDKEKMSKIISYFKKYDLKIDEELKKSLAEKFIVF